MADSELIIRINGDSRRFQEALDEASAKTSELENSLSQVVKVSAAAFAAFTAEIFLSVKAFGESEKATNKLTQALQNQGIYSKDLIDAYKAQADELQNLTGVDDDAIVSGQALLQGMIGQTKISKELTAAVVDLSAAQGIDLESAFSMVGKAIEGNTGALGRYGVKIDENLSKQERLAQITDTLSQRYGGQAEAANKGIGGLKGLASAFGDIQKEIGKNFAPLITVAIEKTTAFVKSVAANKPLLDFITSLITAGAAVAGIGVVVSGAGLAFLKLRAALIAAQVATSAMSIAVKGLVGATGIGILVLIATEVYLNWKTVWPAMQAIFQAFVNNVSKLGQGLSTILSGVFSLDLGKIKQGLDQVKQAFLTAYDQILLDVQDNQDKIAKSTEENALKQNEILKEAADQRAVAEEEERIRKEEQALIDKELEEIKREEDVINKANLEAALTEAENQAALERAKQAILNAQTREDRLKAIKEKADLEDAMRLRGKEIREEAERKKSYENAVITSKALADNSANLANNLVTLTDGKNRELLALQKSLGIAQITINTEVAALRAQADLGPIAGAVASGIIYGTGATSIAIVSGLKLAEGGIVEGGLPGKDSVPALLTPGELVVPTQNYEEVVNSVADLRARSLSSTREDSETGFGSATIMIGFDGAEASQVLTARMNEDRALGISRAA